MTDASVDLAARQIKVTGKRNKQRIVPFGEELAREFEAYLNAREELQGVKDPMLFVNENGAAVTESQVSNLVKKYLSMVTTIEKKVPSR